MSSKRATIAAANSLKSISNVFSSDPIKSLTSSLRHRSTAAERLDPLVADSYRSENLPANGQNPNALCSNYESPADTLQTLKLNPRGGHGKHPVGQNIGRCESISSEFGNSSVGAYRESYGREYRNRQSGEDANFHGFRVQTNSGWSPQSASVVRVEASMGSEQRPGGFQQNRSGVSPGRFENGGFQQSAAKMNGYANDYQGGVSTGRLENGFQLNSSVNENANDSNIQSTGFPSNSYPQGFKEANPKPDSFYSQGLPSGMQGLAAGNYSRNPAGPQNNAGQNMWNSGTFQNGSNMSQQSSYWGQYQINPSNTQSGSAGYEATTDSQRKEESSVASQSSGYVGSIEEFDVFSREGKVKEVVEVLKLLESNGIPIDLPRYVQLMWLCGYNKAVEEAKAVHEHIVRCTSPVSLYTYNRILEMYLNCNAMDEAFAVFDNMVERNLTTWDTMITGLAKSGLGEEAIDTFTKFKEAGLKPDGQMFISVFSACGVVGDAHEGMLHFKSMSKDYGITLSVEHYVSVVDMLGRSGHLQEALEFTEKMPFQPSVEVWETLMNLCRIHGERELGDRCAELVRELDPSRLNEQSRSGLVPVDTSEMAKEEEKKKAAKKNLLEARSTVHEYRAGDTSHPETDRIYAQLRGLRGLMKEAGYVPETRFVLHDVDQESKEDALLGHSERLAVSYGLLSSPARAPIRVIKNLRVCGDCHNAMKIMSKLVGREFIMRDAKRFHHFKDGVCSCRDYW